MRRRILIPVAIALAVLVVTGVVAAVLNTNTAVGDAHTTTTDFSNARTLENVTVTNGQVRYETAPTEAYNTVSDSGDGSTDDSRLFVGSLSSDDRIDSGIEFVPDFSGNVTSVTVDISAVTNGGPDTNDIHVSMVQDDVEDVTLGNRPGTTVNGSWSPDGTTGPQTIEFDTEFEVSANTVYTIVFVSDGYSQDGQKDSLEIATDNAATETRYKVGGSNVVTYNEWANATLNAAGAEGNGTYVSANLTTSDPTQAFTNLSTLENASVTVNWEYYNGSAWVDATTNTYTTAGNKTVSLSTAEETWRANVTFENQSTNGEASVRLSDEGLQFTNQEPLVDNSSASPQGNSGIDQRSVDLSINASDREFVTAQGEQLTVEFFVSEPSESGFDSVGTDTLNANGTATVSVSVDEGGSHDWYAVVSDDYGLSNTSATFAFKSPATLTIREETPPHEKITGVTAELIFYETTDDDPVIINKTTSNAKIDLTGLPTTSTFAVQIDAAGYHNRTILLEDLFDQQTAFLINKTRTTVANRFDIEDRTGDFPARGDTKFFVQKAINRSLYNGAPSGFSWTNVAGDTLGADSAFSTDLIFEDRYRLVVKNAQGDTRILGSHVAATSGTIALEIGQIRFGQATGEGFSVGATLNESNGNWYAIVDYSDPENQTTKIVYNITNEDTGTVALANTTINGPLGSARAVESVSNPYGNYSYEVTVWVTRNGETTKYVQQIGQAGNLDPPLDNRWMELVGYVAILAMTGLTVIVDSRLGALTGAASATLLTMVGIVAIPTPALGVGAAMAVLFSVGDTV